MNKMSMRKLSFDVSGIPTHHLEDIENQVSTIFDINSWTIIDDNLIVVEITKDSKYDMLSGYISGIIYGCKLSSPAVQPKIDDYHVRIFNEDGKHVLSITQIKNGDTTCRYDITSPDFSEVALANIDQNVADCFAIGCGVSKS